MLTENPHHLSDPEYTNLELEEDIRLGNSLDTHIVKKLQRYMSLFHFNERTIQ